LLVVSYTIAKNKNTGYQVMSKYLKIFVD